MSKHYKLTCTDPNTSWHKTPIYFCEVCLNKRHKHLLKDWFIKSEETGHVECSSPYHKTKQEVEDV